MRKLIFALGVIYLSLGCATGNHGDGEIENVDEGYKMFSFPRTTYPPGYVFRVAKGEKMQREITLLKADKPYNTGNAYIPVKNEERTLTGNLFFKFMAINPTDSILKADALNKRQFMIDIGQGFLESYDEKTIDSLIKHADINWRSDSKYYIVQGTISSKHIAYKKIGGGQVNVNALINIKALGIGTNLHKDKIDSTSLIQDFDSLYRVYYTAWEIVPSGVGSSNERVFTYNKKAQIKIE